MQHGFRYVISNMAAPHAVAGVEGGSGETELILSDSAAGEDAKRPQFGTRFLTDPRQVFQHNAWWVKLIPEIRKGRQMLVAFLSQPVCPFGSLIIGSFFSKWKLLIRKCKSHYLVAMINNGLTCKLG